MSKRIGLVMSDELVSLIDGFASLNNISRSAAICVLCSQSLSQSQALDTLKRLMDNCDSLPKEVSPPSK